MSQHRLHLPGSEAADLIVTTGGHYHDNQGTAPPHVGTGVTTRFSARFHAARYPCPSNIYKASSVYITLFSIVYRTALQGSKQLFRHFQRTICSLEQARSQSCLMWCCATTGWRWLRKTVAALPAVTKERCPYTQPWWRASSQ